MQGKGERKPQSRRQAARRVVRTGKGARRRMIPRPAIRCLGALQGALLGALLGGLLILSTGLVGCAGNGGAGVSRRDFAYADGGFSASIRGTATRLDADGNAEAVTSAASTPQTGAGHTTVGEPMPISAEVTVGAPRPTGERDLTVTFASPASLEGVQVARRYTAAADGTLICRVTVTSASNLSFDDSAAPGAYDPLLRFAEALLPAGDVVEVSPVRDGARTVTCRASDGDHTAVFTFSEEGGLPVTVQITTTTEVLALTVTPRG